MYEFLSDNGVLLLLFLVGLALVSYAITVLSGPEGEDEHHDTSM
jgi:hypothetical protein